MQTSTGNQYFNHDRALSTAHETKLIPGQAISLSTGTQVRSVFSIAKIAQETALRF